MSDISESVKQNCFEECGILSHHRNIISYLIFGVSNLASIALGAMRISHPLIPIGFTALNGMAHFLKTSSSSTKQKHIIEQQHEQIKQLSLTDENGQLRRLTIEQETRPTIYIPKKDNKKESDDVEMGE